MSLGKWVADLGKWVTGYESPMRIGDMATSVRNGAIVGNGDINFVTPLSLVVLTLYLAWCLFRIKGISHIPRCYSN